MQQDIEITTGPVSAGGCCGGGCCGGGAVADETPVTASTFAVEGMTCGHCVGAVTEELSQLDGVRSVRVDLVAGGRSSVYVDTDGPIDREAVRTAVDEAGYTLVD